MIVNVHLKLGPIIIVEDKTYLGFHILIEIFKLKDALFFLPIEPLLSSLFHDPGRPSL